jgi:hypothetical protein
MAGDAAAGTESRQGESSRVLIVMNVRDFWREPPALFCFLRESCNGRHGKRLKLKVLWIQSANF